MSYEYQKRKRKKKNGDLDFLAIFSAVFWTLFFIGILWFLKWVYFDIYKPKEKKFINNSRYAYMLIQDELTKYYREKGYVYSEENNDGIDEFCEILRTKYSPLYGRCNIETIVSNEPNIIFAKKGIHIYGFERQAFKADGTLVKDIIIDVNGEKGENAFGVDQVPLRIYSTGRMGGMLSPVNCKKEDLEDYGISYSPICPAGFDFNFMDSKIPFSYDVIQVGGRDGKSRRLNQNVPFLRADCIAFGSEILGADEYCEKRGYHWLTACYHEYFCAINFHENNPHKKGKK